MDGFVMHHAGDAGVVGKVGFARCRGLAEGVFLNGVAALGSKVRRGSLTAFRMSGAAIGDFPRAAARESKCIIL